MSFRRSKDTAAEKQRWRAFVIEYRGALMAIGMPEQLFREKSSFDHWLMHGQHPLDPSGFAVEQIDHAKRDVLINLISAYMDAGFGSPGISILSNAELQRISTARVSRRR
jgi:hypothetical protein